MTNDEMIVALRAVAKNYEGKFVATFETNINAMATDAADHIERLCDENNFLKAEIERLEKKDNEWALSYANSVARGILKREEAIKELAKKVENALAPTVSALFHISETLVEASKQHTSSKPNPNYVPPASIKNNTYMSLEEALKNIRVQLSEKQPICSKLQLEEVLNKCVKEIED